MVDALIAAISGWAGVGNDRFMHGSAKPAVLHDDFISALASDARIFKVELTGSRARGQVTPLSDWDFAVTHARCSGRSQGSFVRASRSVAAARLFSRAAPPVPRADRA